MPTENITVVPSQPLRRALNLPSNAAGWQSLVPQNAAPSLAGSTVSTDTGVFAMGSGGSFAPSRLKLVPYCAGSAGAQFSFRLYAWEHAGEAPQSAVWFPLLLAEFLCTGAILPGPPAPPGNPNQYELSDAEDLCDTVQLVQGSAGPTGNVFSAGPGTNLAAFAVVEILGARRVQFDFAQLSGGVAQDNVSMNCYFCRA